MVDKSYCSSEKAKVLSGIREKKHLLEKKINAEFLKKLSAHSICAASSCDDEFINYDESYINDYFSSLKLEWEVYDLMMEECEDENICSNSNTCRIPSSFLDTRTLPASLNGPHNAIFENFSEMDDVWQSLIVRAEGLWAFGHIKEACFIGRKVAEHILSHPPDQKVMCCGAFVKPKRRKVSSDIMQGVPMGENI